MTVIFNSLLWPVSLGTQHKVPRLGSFCLRLPLKDSGSILHQSPTSYNTKDRLLSLQYPRLLDLFTVAKSSSLCILLACMDASAVPSFSINSVPSLTDSDSQSLTMAMDVMDIPIPVPAGADDIIYASAPELAASMKKNENYKYFAGCPQWDLNEYEIVVPNLPRKPNSKSFPRHGYYWTSVHNQASPSLPWNPKFYYTPDNFAQTGGTGNRQIIKPADGNMLSYECFSL